MVSISLTNTTPHYIRRVLGVGSIPSVTLGSSGYQSQSTKVPLNGAYILSEDQNGVGAFFGSSRNYFDYGSGTKNTIAQTSENFVTAVGNFSTTEQGSLVSQQLTGVCNSSSGCTGSYGVQTSVSSYKLYPLSSADIITRSAGTAGKFFTASGTSVVGASVSTTSPGYYWLRSPDRIKNVDAPVIVGEGWYPTFGIDYDYAGFRPAGVLNLDGAQCLLAANISLRKLFKLENADK